MWREVLVELSCMARRRRKFTGQYEKRDLENVEVLRDRREPREFYKDISGSMISDQVLAHVIVSKTIRLVVLGMRILNVRPKESIIQAMEGL